MMNQAGDNQADGAVGGRDTRLMEAALDRLGRAERDAAPAGFEERMASTSAFALRANANIRHAGPTIRTRLMARIAAMVAVLGVVGWTLLNSIPGGKAPLGQTAANVGATESRGDDSEVFSLVARALDGGTGSEIDVLLQDASELDLKIADVLDSGSGVTDDSLEGSTM